MASNSVLNLGTALGFTACCLVSSAEATQVDTVEGDPQHALLTQANIEAAGLGDRIPMYRGRFEDVLPTLRGAYAMAFFDGLSPSAPVAAPIVRAFYTNSMLKSIA
jgi:predicted O-methyltransferase YrrM